MIANAVVASGKCSNVNRSEEFLKAGLMMKTVRVQADGIIKEAMSFENIDYMEVAECGNWYESRLYELYSSRFLFVVFRERHKGKGDYELDDAFFGLCPNPTWNVLRYIGNISRRISWKVISQRTIGGKLAIERSSMYGQKPRKQKTLHLRLTGKVQRSFAIGLIMTT